MGTPSPVAVGDNVYVEVKPDVGDGTFWYKTTISEIKDRYGKPEAHTDDVVTGAISLGLLTRPDSTCPSYVQNGHVLRTTAKHNWCSILPQSREPRIVDAYGSHVEVKSPKRLKIEIVGDWALIGAQFYQPEEDNDEHLFFCVRLGVLCERLADGLLTPFDESDNYKFAVWCEDSNHVNEEADDARKELAKLAKPLPGYRTATEVAVAEHAADAWKKSLAKKTDAALLDAFAPTQSWSLGQTGPGTWTCRYTDTCGNTVSPNFPRAQAGSSLGPAAAGMIYSEFVKWKDDRPIGVALQSAKPGQIVEVKLDPGQSLSDIMQQKIVDDFNTSMNRAMFEPSRQHLNSTPSTEETTMANSSVPTTAPTALSKTVSDVGDAVVHGASVAAAQEAYDTILELTTAAGLPSSTLGFLQSTMFGRVLLYIGVPTVLMFLCNMFPSSIPQADNVNRACKLVVDGASRDFLRPMFLVMSSPLKKLASIGATAVTTPPSEQK